MANKPYVVVEWNDTETDAKGWMCAYNFVGHYCGGGTRMHPTVTKEEVIRLATTMGYKYKACESQTTGGCKAGIAYDYKAPDALDVLKRFLTATAPYINAGVSIGGDLGVDYSDVLRILDELGIGIPQTKAMKEEAKQSVVDMKADAVEAREDTQQVRRDAVEARNEVLEDKKQMRKDKPEIEMAVNREPREEAVVIGYGSMKQQDGKVFDILKKDKPLLRPLELKSNMRPAKGVEYAKPDPLVILDGVEYTGTLDKIDANKIESMSILKDERAEDIYGSKAAGGVILITTKRVSK